MQGRCDGCKLREHRYQNHTQTIKRWPTGEDIRLALDSDETKSSGSMCSNAPNKDKAMSKKPQRIHFGKHRGKRFQELPMDYLFWLLANASKRETVEAAESEFTDEPDLLMTRRNLGTQKLIKGD